MVKTARIVLLITTVLAVVFFTTSNALAGGWHVVGPDHDPDAGLWANNSGEDSGSKDENKVPHLNLQTSSNNCRTCHAVHNADYEGSSGFKLLRNKNRVEECNFCHGPSGALTNPTKKPYAPMVDANGVEIPAKGQHTLGAKAIPDSTITSGNSIFSDGLSCGNCHSVHGGFTLNDLPDAGRLATKILRRDPANNGIGPLGNGAADGVIAVAEQGQGNKPIAGQDTETPTEGQYLAAFCGDCHNKNVNWDRGGSGNEGDAISTGVSEGERPNSYAHPMGKVDGLIDIYGRLKRVADPLVIDRINANDQRMSCDDCHTSRAVSPSKFPHQSVGHKLLNNNYTDSFKDANGNDIPAIDPVYTDDPNRVLPNLDGKVCRTCHGKVEGGTFAGISDPSNSNSF